MSARALYKAILVKLVTCLGRESYTTVAVSPSSPTFSLPMVRAIPWGQGAVLGGRRWQQACGFGRELLVGVGAEVRAVLGAENCGGSAAFGLTVQSLDKAGDLPVLCKSGSPSVHGSFWMNFLRFLRECRLQS